MGGAGTGASALWGARDERDERDERDARPLVTAADSAAELMRLVSLDVRKPLSADRRGLLTPRGAATLGAALAITDGVGVDRACDAGVRGKGSPANTDDSDAEFGLEAAVDAAE